MGEAITLGNFALAGAGFILTCVINTWGVIKYMIGRMDKQNEENQRAIAQLRAQAVTREEHARDYDRLRNEVHSLREAVDRQGVSIGTRLDAILMHLTTGGKP